MTRWVGTTPSHFLRPYLLDIALLSPSGHQVCGDVLRSIAHHPDYTNSFAISVGVVASNHLMLSLIEEANDRPILMEPLTSTSRPSTGVVIAIQAQNTTPSYDDQLQTVSFPFSPEGNHRQRNLGWNLDT